MAFLLILALVLSQGPFHQNAKTGDSTQSKADSKKGVTGPLPTVVRHDSAPTAQPNAYQFNAEPAKEHGLITTDRLMALFTFVLTVVAVLQFKLLGKQNQLIKDQFTATFRPHFILRRLTFHGTTDNPFPKPPKIRVEMANIGAIEAASATVYMALGIFDTGQPIAWKLIEELDKATPNPMILEPGLSASVIVELGDRSQTMFDDPRVVRGECSIYFVGFLIYSDPTGTISRRTGFLRRADLRNHSFQPVDLPGFDYSD